MKIFRVLVGLLLVCAVMVVVLGCLAVWEMRSHPPQVNTRTVLNDLRVALFNFHVDYQRFPGQPDKARPADLRIESTGAFLDCLINQNTEWNPQKIVYIDVPKARDGKGGYIPAEGSNPSRLVDRWGSPYVILLDTNGDKTVENPDVKNSDPQILLHVGEPPPPTLATEVAAFSLGIDKVAGTGDDIVSWRAWGMSASGLGFWQTYLTVPFAVVLSSGMVAAWFYPWRSKSRGSSSAAVS